MTLEQQLRDQLDLATRDTPVGPDLARSIRDGRRRRRTTRAGLAVAAVAVLAVGGVGVHAFTGAGDGAHTVAHDAPVAAAPPAAAAPTDFVAGTTTDDTLAAVVAELLPSLPAPDDVYPSDSHTAGPLPDSAYTSAEDWQASYTIGDEQVLLITGLASEGPNTCADCDTRAVPGGTLFHQTSNSVGPDGRALWSLGTFFTRPDGTFTNVFEYVTAPGLGAAQRQRALTDAQLEALVQDPRLSFASLTSGGS